LVAGGLGFAFEAAGVFFVGVFAALVFLAAGFVGDAFLAEAFFGATVLVATCFADFVAALFVPLASRAGVFFFVLVLVVAFLVAMVWLLTCSRWGCHRQARRSAAGQSHRAMRAQTHQAQ
jgi:hypothetical protein